MTSLVEVIIYYISLNTYEQVLIIKFSLITDLGLLKTLTLKQPHKP